MMDDRRWHERWKLGSRVSDVVIDEEKRAGVTRDGFRSRMSWLELWHEPQEG